jgi:hypothetical protein
MRSSTQTAPKNLYVHLKAYLWLLLARICSRVRWPQTSDDDPQNCRSRTWQLPQTVETALVFYQPQFRGEGGGTAGSLTSINCVLQKYFWPTVSVKMHPNL